MTLGTELGGGGTVTPHALHVAERGLRRALAHLAALPPDPADEAARPDRRLQVGGYPFHVYARDEGVFEPLAGVEDTVSAGQPAALIHPVHTPWQAPVEARFAQAGIGVCARVPGRVERSSCLRQDHASAGRASRAKTVGQHQAEGDLARTSIATSRNGSGKSQAQGRDRNQGGQEGGEERRRFEDRQDHRAEDGEKGRESAADEKSGEESGQESGQEGRKEGAQAPPLTRTLRLRCRM